MGVKGGMYRKSCPETFGSCQAKLINLKIKYFELEN